MGASTPFKKKPALPSFVSREGLGYLVSCLTCDVPPLAGLRCQRLLESPGKLNVLFQRAQIQVAEMLQKMDGLAVLFSYCQIVPEPLQALRSTLQFGMRNVRRWHAFPQSRDGTIQTTGTTGAVGWSLQPAYSALACPAGAVIFTAQLPDQGAGASIGE